MNTQAKILSIALLAGALCAPAARAQVVISENFTDAATNNPWIPFLGACLTAGNNTGTVPACMTNSTTPMSYYSNQVAVGSNSPLRGGYTGNLPDPVGYGALRFTNANTAGTNNGFNEAGGIMSGFTYSTNAGVEVIFTTYTYEGNSGGGASDGADGMTFFMMDGGIVPYDVGAFGGSLGYTCSNANNDSKLHPDGTARGYDGLRGAVLGLGIDEYGNFLNPGDNTHTGPGYVPQRIGLRGAGSITWGDLSLAAATNAYYPLTLTTSQRAAAVQNTCQTGTIWNYAANPNIPTNATNTSVVTTNTIIGPLGVPIITTTTTYPWRQYNTGTAINDYGAVPNGWSVLSASTKLANESAMTRGAATPITYKLKIAPAANGFSVPTLSFWYNINGGAWQSVLTNQDVLTASGLAALPATVRFGFAGSSGGSNNVHEILCFQAAPAQESASSVSLNQKQTAQVQIGTQVYFASYNTTNYAGDLTANPLTTYVDGNGVTQVQINSQANWDASCVLTGGACAATGATNTAMTPASRTILTWNPAATTPVGVPFEAANLSSAENSALTAGDTGMGSPDTARLAFLRGDTSNQLTVEGTGFFRDRNSILGDIVDSSPTWVGAPSIPYPATFTDLLTSSDLGQTNTADPLYENIGETYANFASMYAARTDVVYVGANDGLLHGHRAGSYNGGVYNNTNNDGTEVLAYMPAYVVQDIHVPGSYASEQALDFSNANYGHNFYLDGTPGNGDVYYGGAWHSWLVGGLGAGGSAIYALNVTNPDNSSMSDPIFSEANAQSLVMGEWSTTVATTVSEGTGNPNAVYYGGTGFCTGTCTSSTAVVGTTLTCAGSAAGNAGSNGTLNAACGLNLGSTYGVPQIRRFHNGWWGAVFGNGSGSPTGAAGIYVMLINPSTGSATTAPTMQFYYIQAAAGTGNGIDFVTPADLDGDHTVDYVYAGDIQGNVWRFDLTSSNPANWSAATKPLFTTSAGAAQPITTKLVVVAVPSGTSAPRILVEFGTGSQTPFTITTPTSYSTGTQTLYGIWDWNMANWNSVSTTQFASLGTATTGTAVSYSGNTICGTHNSACTTSNLTAQTVTSAATASFQTQAACTGSSSGTSSTTSTGTTSGSSSSTDACTYYRTVSSNPICWDASTQCTSGNTSFGWYLDLPGTQEQIIYSPALEAGAFVVNTTIPPISGSSCVITAASGYTMAISPSTGGAFTNSFFGDDNGNFVTVNGSIVSGLELNGTGTPTMVTSGVSTFLVTQTVSGSGTVVAVNPNASAQSHRLTWLEMR
jgi:type IV pilus assembly protein PilY1